MMCGRFTENIGGNYGPVEWNAGADPHATSIVYHSEVALHRSVGLDVTSKVTMSATEFRKEFRRFELFRPLMDFAEIWFRDWPEVTFHDPLAATTIFDAGICSYQKGMVEVDLSPGETAGALRWGPGVPPARHEVAVEVDTERFFSHFLSVFQ